MKPNGSILALAHQIGSGRAIAPVIRALRSRGHNVVVAASGQAVEAFERDHIAFSVVDLAPESMPKAAAEMIGNVPPAAILTGTSTGVTFEKVVIEIAKRRGIQTISVLDHWSNYLARFEGPSGIDHYFPGCLAVMDETARRDLVAIGYADDAIALTGQPAFDGILTLIRKDRAAIREQFGVHDDERLVVFASEPQRRDHGDSLGYDETDALRMLLDSIADLPDPKPRVLIKPHPTESTDALATVAAAYIPRPTIIGDVDRWELALAADVVVGMTSLILIESALLGTPAISVQPDLPGADAFVGNRLGVVDSANTREACERSLSRFLGAHSRPTIAAAARRVLGVDGDAAARVSDLIEKLMRRDALRVVQSQVF